MLIAQLCPTLSDPMDYSPPGSSVHGILQAKILEWVVIPYPEYLPCPIIKPMSLMSSAFVGLLYCLSYQGSPYIYTRVCVRVYPFFFRFFSHMCYCRILSRFPCAIVRPC